LRKLKFSSVNVTLYFILNNNIVRQRNRFYHRKFNYFKYLLEKNRRCTNVKHHTARHTELTETTNGQ
jgi:hypothetical protein